MRAVLAAILLLAARPVHADEILAKSGALERGINLDLFEVGPMEAHSTGGTGVGVRLAVGGEVELGPHWAVRVPLVLALTGSGTAHAHGFAELDVVPGLVYRFRTTAHPSFVPYLGGGLKLGAWGADRPFVGQPLIAANVPRIAPGLGDLFDEHHHTSDGSGGDPNFDAKVSAGVEGWAGGEWRPSTWFAVRLGLALGLVRVDRTLIETLSETITLRVSI